MADSKNAPSIPDRSHTADRVGAVVARGSGHAPRPKNLKCPGGCRGAGWRYPKAVGSPREACPECNAEGRPEETPTPTPRLDRPKNLKCPGKCNGSGEVWVHVPDVGDRKAPCPACRDPIEVRAAAGGFARLRAEANGATVETIGAADVADARVVLGLGE